jgi:hypothetical protein
MNVVTTTWRQLVRSKLWPVALILLAALVAVPFLLAREPEAPEPLAPLPVASEADDSIAEPVVAKVSTEDRDRRRRVLGVRKDPFEPAPVKKPKTEQEQGTAPTPVEQAPSGGSTDTGGGEPAPEKTYYDAGTIIVRFGEATERAELATFAIDKMGPVPDETLPLLVYMGLTKDGKKAKFLVDASVEVDGDGNCKPHKANCEVIELAVGETEFLDVLDTEDSEEESTDDETTEETEETEETGEPEILASFQLDLVDIKRAGDSDVR